MNILKYITKKSGLVIKITLPNTIKETFGTDNPTDEQIKEKITENEI